ncbi:MAG: hypothetical protein ACJ76H_02655 [Bacteriovoracaceae bacterium]
MLYTGYTEDELKELIAILERYQIPFEVQINEDAIAQANAIISNPNYHSARRGAQVDNSFYSISFDRSGLRNLSVPDFDELKKLRVFAEHFDLGIPEEKKVPAVTRMRNISYVGSTPLTALIIIAALLCLSWAWFNWHG